MADRISYTEGYKYQLVGEYTARLSFTVGSEAETRWLHLTPAGFLTIKDGYAWDGPSGPTIDSKNFMRGSLIHDALYQLMRKRLLSMAYRDDADRELQRVCLEDGMGSFRAWYVYAGVRFGGGPAADPRRDNPVITAP